MSNRQARTESLLFHHSSVRALEDQRILTSPAGRGIWRSDDEGGWESWIHGLPSNVHVNRLCEGIDRGKMFACTDLGLYEMQGRHWTDMKLPIVCYAYRELGQIGFAATEHGLWCNTAKGWRNIASAQNAVYDFYVTPQYIYLALPWGIAMYDRLTCAWEQFTLGAAIVRLAAFEGALLGITDKGKIVRSNREGSFERFELPGIFVFNAVQQHHSLYFCTDRGLYRAANLRGQLALLSVTLGCPTTDLDLHGGRMHLATLHEGIQTIQWH